MLRHFFDLPAARPDLPPEKRDLYRLLTSATISIASFQALTGIGIITIAVLALTGYFDTPDDLSLLFVGAGINIVNSILHLFMFPLLRREKMNMVAVLLMAINGSFSAAQIFIWQGVIWFPIVLVLSATIVLGSTRSLAIRYRLVIIATSILLLAAVIFADSQISYQRLGLTNLNNFAALSLALIFITTMLVIGIMNGMVNFRALSTRLITTFTTLTVITIIVFVIISAFANYLDSRSRSFEQLKTISNLKASQVNLALERLQRQVEQPFNNSVAYRSIFSVLTGDLTSVENRANIDYIRVYLTRIQGQVFEEEYLLVGKDSQIILSTNRDHENLDVSTQAFMEAAKQNIPFFVTKDFLSIQGEYSILVFSPLFIQNKFFGVLILRTDFSQLNEVTSITPGISQTIETYLVSQVDGITVPTTTIREATNEVDTFPVRQAFDFNLTQGSGTYTNYAGTEVFGHYAWIPAIRSVLISEVDQQEVLTGLTTSLPIYLSIGAVMILLVFVSVFITSQTISQPIQEFTQKAAALAEGELSIRIASERQDEIGALAASFDVMAGELENTVRTLEIKVEERTKDLQKQADYMRIAAEVARDATTSQNLDELLNHAAYLIWDRFDFYHAGIFLVDTDEEFAVLRASPTEAGRKMLEQGHRLRLGQVGLVGYAAATGTPRIALDTGRDAAYFNNPLLPNTRSEIAIPLKLDAKVLGVLDVQSTQPEAFTQDDIAILQVVADQLALAIQRVELVSNLQRNLVELENTYKALTSESWQQFSQEPGFRSGYVFDGLKITPLESLPAKAQKALAKGRTAILPPQQDADGTTVVAPLRLREQIIGGLTLRFQGPSVDSDTVSLIEETAARLAIALENARLYAETQNLVQRERTVSEISSHITTSFNIETILRTAVIEIGRRMPDAEVIVQIEQDKD